MGSIFLSHNHRDKAFVRRLGADLQVRGATVWIDEAELRIGDSLLSKIQDAVASFDYVGAVLSTNSIDSRWVQLELRMAMTLELEHGRVRVLPLLLDDCPLPVFLRDKLYADFRRADEYRRSLELVAERLGLHAERVLSFSDSVDLIAEFARTRKVEYTVIEPAAQSPFGTHGYRAAVADGMGVLYVHSSGPRIGQTYYVRKGIALLYEQVLGGSKSPLGYPVSNEELVDGKGFPTSFFEGGFIEWSPETAIARAIGRTAGGEAVVLTSRRV
jgi:hypothetical protein